MTDYFNNKRKSNRSNIEANFLNKIRLFLPNFRVTIAPGTARFRFIWPAVTYDWLIIASPGRKSYGPTADLESSSQFVKNVLVDLFSEVDLFLTGIIQVCQAYLHGLASDEMRQRKDFLSPRSDGGEDNIANNL